MLCAPTRFNLGTVDGGSSFGRVASRGKLAAFHVRPPFFATKKVLSFQNIFAQPAPLVFV